MPVDAAQVAASAGRRGRTRVLGPVRRILTVLLSATSLFGCFATGPRFAPSVAVDSRHALIVVYRISQVGGTAGTWVPARLELNGAVAGKLPADSFLVRQVPAGEVTLAVTDLIDLRYAAQNRVTLRGTVSTEETAYFRLLSVFGDDCAVAGDEAMAGMSASATHHPRPDWAQTTCLSRVPEPIALKDLQGLRQAN